MGPRLHAQLKQLQLLVRDRVLTGAS